MLTAQVFENEGSQVVSLPKEFRFSQDEVVISKVGDVVMLVPKENRWSGLLQSLDMFSDDFMVNKNG